MTALFISCSFNSGYPKDPCEMALHSGFDLHFSRNIYSNDTLAGRGVARKIKSKPPLVTTSLQQQQPLTKRHNITSPCKGNPALYWCKCKLQQRLWKGWKSLKWKQLSHDPSEAQTYKEICSCAYRSSIHSSQPQAGFVAENDPGAIILLSLTYCGYMCVHHYQLSFAHFFKIELFVVIVEL